MTLGVFLWSALFTEILFTGSPIEPELADAASPIDQLVLKISSLSPKGWDYSQASVPTRFYMGSGGLRFYMRSEGLRLLSDTKHFIY